jgi:hypothetical protein
MMHKDNGDANRMVNMLADISYAELRGKKWRELSFRR